MELKEEDRKLLRSAIEAASKITAQPTVQQSIAPISSLKDEAEPTHLSDEDIERMLACPECFPKVKKHILARYANELKGKEVVKCKGCGLSVSKTEEKCPSCGGTSAE